jgi:putative peptide zinc metalloprotease protein
MFTEQREILIRALPCFSMLSKEEARELAVGMFEKNYASGETIVAENELVDSVYILVSGQAEVNCRITQNKIPLAILNRGEAIGLNDTGFFSETGQRTATVIALSEVKVIGLLIKDLHVFLQKHPAIISAMQTAAEQILRIQLIKQSLPFYQLSHKRLVWLANQVEAITVPAGAELFRQGDDGDSCYLIRKGQVDIFTQNEDGSERRLAVLSAPTLFGEATLITRSPRNATARAIDECKLFVLRHHHLSELIETEDNVANMFMTLMIDRSRPLKNPDVTMHSRVSADGQAIMILKNAATLSYFKLSDQGLYVWEQLNGKHTMQEITLSLAEKFNVFAPDVVAALISRLAQAGFLLNMKKEDQEIRTAEQPFWARAVLKVRRVLEAKVAIGNVDKWLTSSYNKVVHLLFTRVGQVMLAALSIIGVIVFASTTNHALILFKMTPHSWLLVFLLIPFAMVSNAIHELGHAYATKAYGYEVHYMGIGWYWVGPVAFTDTSDMWLSTRGPRIVVNLAGVFADLISAGIATLLIYVVPNAYAQAFLWLYALYTYINIFRMMSPLLELDGYYVLMDLLERPNLHKSSVVWLVKEFPQALRQPSLFKKNWPEVCYWLACIVYLILISILTLLLQTFVFKIIGIHSSNPFVSLALPFFVVIVSSLSIIADIRSQS